MVIKFTVLVTRFSIEQLLVQLGRNVFGNVISQLRSITNQIALASSKLWLFIKTKMADSPWSNSCWQYFIKPGEHVYGHYGYAKFGNQHISFSHFRVMALKLYKNVKFASSKLLL